MMIAFSPETMLLHAGCRVRAVELCATTSLFHLIVAVTAGTA
jgi:hypothetical protein